MVPNSNSGKYYRKKFWQVRYKLFLEGCYFRTIAAYGIKRIPKDRLNDELTGFNPHILVPGSTQKIEIVRLIFQLFVSYNYTITEISNLLNAQGIKALNNSKTWRGKKIISLMSSPVYIGSNQYYACVENDIFQALIGKPAFCVAQTKIFGKDKFSFDMV
jgi:hypothetical protein